MIAAASHALAEYGLGATGSRLVRGTTDVHSRLESSLASFMGTPTALVYSSGYLANLGAVRALASLSPRTVLVADEFVHASLVDGCRLAAVSTVFDDHASLSSLESVLAAHAGQRLVVITESVFSVDGDLAPLASLHEIARSYGAMLLVDDAHGLGVVRTLDGLAGQDDVVITATLSKALGGAGGVVAGPDEVIRHLIDTGRTFIFDTALPPAVAAGVEAALALATPALAREVVERAAYAHKRLSAAGLAVRPPAGGILSVQAPSAAAAVAWTDALRARGIAVGCFRPPSTPDQCIPAAPDGQRRRGPDGVRGGVGDDRGDCPMTAALTGPVLVTGTDTGVGKTIVTAAIAACATAAGLRVAVVKPGQTGVDPAYGEVPDEEVIARLAGPAHTRTMATYPDPLAPLAAARVAQLAPLDLYTVVDTVKHVVDGYDLVLVEGAGGLLVPMGPRIAEIPGGGHWTVADLAVSLGVRRSWSPEPAWVRSTTPR